MGRADDVTATTTHQLYERYGRQIYAYCLHQLRSREEAEDAVQTTFLNAFRSLKGGAVTHAEQAWLYKIAQNVCSARRSSSARRLRLETPNDFDVLQETIPAQSRDSAVELIGLEDALEAMPENQRRAILLREWQGLSYREIGEELELSQASVEMLIFRARRNLAGALEQPAEENKLKRKVGRTLNLGSVFAAIKSLLTGGAAVKAVALAVAAGTVSVTATAVQHTILRSRPHIPAHTATTLSVAPLATRTVTPTPKAPVVVERTSSPATSAQHAIVTPRYAPVGGKARLAVDDVMSAPVVTAAAPPAQAPAPVQQQPQPQPQPQPTQESSPPPSAPKPQDAPPQSSGTPAAPSAPAPSADKKRKSQDSAGNSADSQPTVTTTTAATTTTTPTTMTTTTTTTTTTDDHGNGEQKKNQAPPQMAPLSAPPTSTTPTTPVTTTAPVTTVPAPQPPADDHGNGRQRKNQDQQPQQPVVTTPAPMTMTPAPQPPADDHGNGRQRKNQDQQQPVVTTPVVTTPDVLTAPSVPVDAGKGHGQGHGK